MATAVAKHLMTASASDPFVSDYHNHDNRTIYVTTVTTTYICRRQ